MLFYFILLLLAFQLVYCALFFLGVCNKLRFHKKEKNYFIDGEGKPAKNWLLAVPVVKEENQLKRCLFSLREMVSDKTSIAVALDGKQYQDLTLCINAIDEMNSVLQSNERKMHQDNIVDEYLNAKNEEIAYIGRLSIFH